MLLESGDPFPKLPSHFGYALDNSWHECVGRNVSWMDVHRLLRHLHKRNIASR